MSDFVLVTEGLLDGQSIPLSRDRDNDENYLTIVVGKNGSGKSRLLRNLALSISFNSMSKELDCFKIYNESELSKKGIPPFIIISNDPSPVSDISKFGAKYICNNEGNLFWPLKNNYPFACYDTLNLTRPSKVICISNSFHHKLPSLIDSPFSKSECKKIKSDIYKNLTLTQVVNRWGENNDFHPQLLGKILPKGILTNSVASKNILELIKNFGDFDGIEFNLKIGNQFDAVVLYEYQFTRKDFADRLTNLDHTLDSDDFTTDILVSIYEKLTFLVKHLHANFLRFNPSEDTNHDGGMVPRDSYILHNSIDIRCTQRNGLEFNINTNIEVIEAILFLSDFNVFRAMNIHLFKGEINIPVDNLSSGELNVFLTLLLINSQIEERSVVLIDEPEINLHPEWQIEILPKIVSCFSFLKGCHFIAATHSPLVASSISYDNSSLVILDKIQGPKLLSPEDIKNKSADFQLFNTLKFPGPHNEYVIRRLMTIIAKRKNDREISNSDYVFINEAAEFALELEDDDQVKYLLAQAVSLI